MPPNRKRRAPNTGRLLVKRTSQKARAPLSDIQHINYDDPDSEDDNAETPEDAVAHLMAAASAGLLGENARAIALVESQANDENVAPGAAAASANANSDAKSGAANAGAAAAQKEVEANVAEEVEDEEDIEYFSDDKLAIADHWEIKLLTQPKSTASSKMKEEWKDALVHKSPFHESLDCRFVVDADKWHAMKVFKHIIKDDVRFRVGDFIGIRPDRNQKLGAVQIPNNNEKKMVLTPKNDWVARIVQLRADGPSRVYALVAWLYWPDHLYTAWSKGESKAKTGRKGYHGDYELIASNHLDIMNVHCFDNNFNHLIEQHYEDLSRDGELTELYWRQTYDFRTGKLSELKRYCKCNKYNKPDQPLIQCTNSAHCGTWLHTACVIDDILSKKWNELRNSDHRLKQKNNATARKKANPPNDINSVIINDSRYRNYLRGKVLADINQVEVTHLHNNIVTNVPIECLKCGCTFT